MISQRSSPAVPYCCVLLSCLIIPFLLFGFTILEGTFKDATAVLSLIRHVSVEAETSLQSHVTVMWRNTSDNL